MLWDSSLKLGIDKIDSQHNELCDRIDTFMAACANQRGAGEVAKTLDFMSDYVKEHFNDEQALHQSVNYPKAMEHKFLHDKFVMELNELKRKFGSQGVNLTVVMQTGKTLIDWVVQHIRGNDKEFAEYYKKLNK